MTVTANDHSITWYLSCSCLQPLQPSYSITSNPPEHCWMTTICCFAGFPRYCSSSRPLQSLLAQSCPVFPYACYATCPKYHSFNNTNNDNINECRCQACEFVRSGMARGAEAADCPGRQSRGVAKMGMIRGNFWGR